MTEYPRPDLARQVDRDIAAARATETPTCSHEESFQDFDGSREFMPCGRPATRSVRVRSPYTAFLIEQQGGWDAFRAADLAGYGDPEASHDPGEDPGREQWGDETLRLCDSHAAELVSYYASESRKALAETAEDEILWHVALGEEPQRIGEEPQPEREQLPATTFQPAPVRVATRLLSGSPLEEQPLLLHLSQEGHAVGMTMTEPQAAALVRELQLGLSDLRARLCDRDHAQALRTAVSSKVAEGEDPATLEVWLESAAEIEARAVARDRD